MILYNHKTHHCCNFKWILVKIFFLFTKNTYELMFVVYIYDNLHTKGDNLTFFFQWNLFMLHVEDDVDNDDDDNVQQV